MANRYLDALDSLTGKQEALDCLLLMQVGAFMKVMDDGARAVSEVTGLKLKMAGDVDSLVVLGGFPKSALDSWVGKLVRAGQSLAIAVQDPAKERRIAEVVMVQCGSKKHETLEASVEGSGGHGAV